MFDSVVGGGPDFAATPQGISLLTQLMTADSRFKRDGLREVYDKARAYYESQQGERLASEHSASIPAEGKSPMSLEEVIAANTKAIEANTAALLKAGSASPAPAPAPATTKTPATKTPAAKATPKAPTHTREELTALATAYREKTDGDQAKAMIKEQLGVDKLKELADDKIDSAFDTLTAQLEALDAGPAEDAGDL